MNETKTFEFDKIIQWLSVLMYIAITSLVNSVVSYVPFIPAASSASNH